MKNIVFVLLFVCCISFAQNTLYSDPNPANHRFLPNNFNTPFGNDLSNIDSNRFNKVYYIVGSPFIANNYVQGSSTILNKKGFTAPMRYNAANDVVEFLDDDRKTKELLRRPYITATFNQKTYEVLSYVKDKKNRLAYFNRLNEGTTQLLFKPKKIIKVGSQKFQGKIQAKYKDASSYYLKKGEQPAEIIRLEKKALLMELSDKKIVLEKFISDYELNLKNEADAVRLIEYYNSLKNPKPTIEQSQS